MALCLPVDYMLSQPAVSFPRGCNPVNILLSEGFKHSLCVSWAKVHMKETENKANEQKNRTKATSFTAHEKW